MSTTTCPHCGGGLRLEPAGRSQRDGHAGDRNQPRTGGAPPLPWTLERARAFVMPLGKYKGRTVAQIGLADPTYLEWCAENLDRNAGMAAKTFLEAERVPAGSAAAADAGEFDEFDGEPR